MQLFILHRYQRIRKLMILVLLIGLGTGNSQWVFAEEEPAAKNEQPNVVAPAAEEDNPLANNQRSTYKHQVTVHKGPSTESFEVNPYTGTATYAFQFEVPPGRMGIQPQLALSYNSNNRRNDSIVGYGWDIPLAYIERDTKHGVPKYNPSDKFVFSLGGATGKLICIMEDDQKRVYRAEIDSAFMKFEWDIAQDTWFVRDKRGTEYRFGSNAGSRMDDPDNTEHVFRWYLDRVQDVHGNFMELRYFKDSGQIYPEITRYTGYNETPGSMTVEFILEERPDLYAGYRPGFAVTTRYRLQSIETKVDGELARKYEFGYGTGSNGVRSLLTSVTPYGNDGITQLPATTFSYYRWEGGWEQAPEWAPPLDFMTLAKRIPIPCFPFECERWEIYSEGVQLVDLNGDGLVDILKRLDDDAGHQYILVALNTGYGWDSATWDTYQEAKEAAEDGEPNLAQKARWAPPMPFASLRTEKNSSYDEGTRLVDLNGDGFVDIIRLLHHDDDQPGTHILAGVALYEPKGIDTDKNGKIDSYWDTKLWEGHGSLVDDGERPDLWNWIPPVNFSFLKREGISYDEGTRIADINADGLADIIRRLHIYDSRQLITVGLNTGENWDNTTWESTGPPVDDHGRPDLYNWIPPSNFAFYVKERGLLKETTYDEGAQLVDFNGDGLVDILRRLGVQEGPTIQQVVINTGHGWEVQDSGSPWELPGNLGFLNDAGTSDTGVRFADINSDGLVDILTDVDDLPVYINTGNGWQLGEGDWLLWKSPYKFTGGPLYDPDYSINYDYGVRLVDVNGDGSVDILKGFDARVDGRQYRDAWLNKGKATEDLLMQVDNGMGVRMTLSYSSATSYPDSSIPFPVQTIKRVDVENGTGFYHQFYWTIYRYSGGYYDIAEREFRGFRQAEWTTGGDTRMQTNVIRFYFHQGDGDDADSGEKNDHFSLAGQVYRTDVGTYNQDEFVLHARTDSTWEAVSVATGIEGGEVFFPKQTKQVNYTYEGQPEYLTTAIEYEYNDSTGDITLVKNHGEVIFIDGVMYNLGDDEIYTHTEYNTTDWESNLFGFPIRTWVTNESLPVRILREQRFYYDYAPYGYVYKGLLTKMEAMNFYGDYWEYPGTFDEVTPYLFVTQDVIYDEYGTPWQTHDANGNVTFVEYDETYHTYPIKRAVPVGGHTLTTQMTYDAKTGQQLTQINPNGVITENVLDPFGRIVEVWVSDPDIETGYEDLIRQASYQYHQGIRDEQQPDNYTIVTTYDGLGNEYKTATYFDGLGRTIQRRTQADGEEQYRVQDFLYNFLNQVTDESIPYFSSGIDYTEPQFISGSTTHYDPIGRPLSIFPPLGEDGSPSGETTISYDIGETGLYFGTRTVTDAAGNQKIYQTDALGRLTTVVESYETGAIATSYQYDLFDNLTSVTDPKGNRTTIKYDSLGRKRELNDPDTGTWLYEYDAVGNLVKQTDSRGNVIEFEYDELNRVTYKHAYNANDVSRIEQLRVTDLTAPSVIRASENKVQLNWTAPNVSFGIYDIRYATAPITEDNWEQAIPLPGHRVVTAPGAQENYTFEGLSPGKYYFALKTQLSQEVRYIYDSRIRGLGRLCSIHDESGDTDFFYDKLGRVIEQRRTIDGIQYTVASQYDLMGRLISLTYPDGESINYGYNAGGELRYVTGTQVSWYGDSYNALGQLLRVRTGDGVSTDYDYYVNHRLKRIVTTPNNLIQLEYSYDKIGNILDINNQVDSGKTQSFTYDRLSRLRTAESEAYGSHAYTYDTIGNLTSKAGVSYGYGSTQPHAVIKFGGETLEYDSAGNLILGRNGIEYQYDWENRLQIARQDGSILAEFVYDGDGGRVKKITPNGTTLYIGKLYELDLAYGKATKHIFAGSTRIASVVDSIPDQFASAYGVGSFWTRHRIALPLLGSGALLLLIASMAVVILASRNTRERYILLRHPARVLVCASVVILFVFQISPLPMVAYANAPLPEGTFYYHTDHLGSASVITDAQGNIVQRLAYLPFGEVYDEETADVDVHYQYTDQERDDETGLYFYNARYYDPVLARFTQADTIVPNPDSSQSLNRYSHVYNNPIRYIDPSGYWGIGFNLFGFGFYIGDRGISVTIAAVSVGYNWNGSAYIGLNYGAGFEVGDTKFQIGVTVGYLHDFRSGRGALFGTAAIQGGKFYAGFSMAWSGNQLTGSWRASYGDPLETLAGIINGAWIIAQNNMGVLPTFNEQQQPSSLQPSLQPLSVKKFDPETDDWDKAYEHDFYHRIHNPEAQRDFKLMGSLGELLFRSAIDLYTIGASRTPDALGKAWDVIKDSTKEFIDIYIEYHSGEDAK